MRFFFFFAMCFKGIKWYGVVSRTPEEVELGTPGEALPNSISEIFK